MKTSDVMTRNVLTVARETSVANAIRVMLDHSVSGLPVLENGKVVGIVTEGDLLRRSETGTERHRPRWLAILMGPGRMAGEYVRTHGRKVEEIMTTDLISVTGIEGNVEDIQARATVVTTKEGRRVVIPNAVLFTNPVAVANNGAEH